MKKRSEILWAGTEASLSDYLEAVARADSSQTKATIEQPDVPSLLEIQGNIGVISIKGPLTNRDSWMNSYMGVTSYNAIREAIVFAAQAPEVTQILLDIDSGGGSVAGVADAGSLIRMINDKVKPVTAFTDGAMASAAYWLGSSAGKVYASKTALVGSIGVIATHMEQSKMLKEAGIGVTVMRAGKYKALANSNEPLTDAAKSQIQDQLDAAYKVFVEQVAESRSVSYAVADSKMAQGREFMGEASVDAGLTDGIESYDSIFTKLSNKSIDTSVKLIDNHGKYSQEGSGMGKKALTEVEIAAMAEGGTAAEAISVVVVVDEALAAATEVGINALTEAQSETTDAEAVVVAVAAAATTPEVKADTGVIDYLQGQIKEKDAQALASGIEISGLQKQVEDMQAAHTGLLEIAGKSLSNMQIALGGAAVNLDGLSATQALAEHTRVSAMFSSKFKAGGVAAVDAAQPEKDNQAPDAMAVARLNAFRTNNK